MSKAVVSAANVGKQYVIGREAGRERYVALRDVVSHRARGALAALSNRVRGRLGQQESSEEFWALRDVSFEINEGDVVGVIGRNGAGKSTLLRILSRITEPSEGRITIKGRVASLLEVGTGFHPELTGRENIFLNGAILGMKRAEVGRKFDQIVNFADVERFLETPVKRYSSGMYMRLAFAVAAFLESDILIVDEVLAVGDAAFQKKCLGQMESVSASGRTVLFVSHNIGSLLAICRTGVLLDAGRSIAQGDIASVARQYQSLGETHGLFSPKAFSGPLRSIEFGAMEVNGDNVTGQAFVRYGEPISLRFHGASASDVPNFRSSFSLYKDGVRLCTAQDAAALMAEGSFTLSIEIPPRLLRPGDYYVALGGRRIDNGEWIWGTDLTTITIMEGSDLDYDREDVGLISLPVNLERSAGRAA